MNLRKLGGAYETVAACYLEEKGYEILHRNYRCRRGEVDLVARDGDILVFVEVKYRTCNGQGAALEAVGRSKQRVLARVAAYYLMKECNSLEVDCRFDVIGIDGDQITHLENAFEAGEW